jgi:hypothetical protein
VFDVRRQAEDARFAAEKRALQDRALSTEAHKKALDNMIARHSAIVALLDNEKSLVSWIAALQSGTESDNLATSVSAKLDLIEEGAREGDAGGRRRGDRHRSAEQKKRRCTWRPRASSRRACAACRTSRRTATTSGRRRSTTSSRTCARSSWGTRR